ncbi:MAG: hypothetical protein WD844_11160 [Thermoleophilaceae bacterium]
MLGWALALAAAAVAALAIADDAGVAGPAALPDVARALAASVAVLGVCGFPLARLLVPESIAAWRPLLVLPLGAVGCALALTLLGFALVPFGVSLPLVLAAGIVGCVLTARRPVTGSPAPAPHLLGLAAVGLLIVAVALVPSFRSGLATVTGFGSDAHMAAGTAFFLQHEHPTGLDTALPIDEVTPAWRSKYPIYYALGAVSTVAGLETWETLMTFGAVMLALAGAGFFLFAHRTFRAGVGVAAVAAAVAILDQRVLHLPMHPYYNQLWGLFTLPFSLVFAHLWFEERSRQMLALLVLFTLMGALAYPLMLPFPGVVIAGAWALEQRRRGERVLPRIRGRRPRWWMVPVGILLAVPIFGVLEKIGQAVALLGNLDSALEDWQGDLSFHPPVGEFLAVADVPGRTALVVLVCLLAIAGVRRMPRRVGLPLLVTLGLAGMAGALFGVLKDGQYLYFKILAFAGPLIVVAAVVAVGSLRGRLRPLAVAGLVLFSASALLGARDEIELSFDQLTPQTIELGEWAERLPPGASIRLDTPPPAQLWEAYILSGRPLGSRRPNPHYPHVPRSAGADYAIDWRRRPVPADRAGPPLLTNSRYRLWKLDGSGGEDTTSRRQFSGGALGSLADPG